MTAWLVLAGGVLLLLWFAVLIGASMDTEAQRRASRALAAQRRLRREGSRAGLCADCPYRSR